MITSIVILSIIAIAEFLIIRILVSDAKEDGEDLENARAFSKSQQQIINRLINENYKLENMYNKEKRQSEHKTRRIESILRGRFFNMGE